jgi:hypothetical protein
MSLATSGMIDQDHRRVPVKVFMSKIAASDYKEGYQKDF